MVEENDPRTQVDLDRIDLQVYEIDFSTITEDVIMDRSNKGETAAKLLVLLQTFWFATQCGARVAQGLTVTKLELTILGHIVFVGVIYFFCWKKPLDVRYPIVLHAKCWRGHASDAASEVDAEVREVNGQVRGADGSSMESPM